MRIRVLGIVLCSALTLSLAGCKKGIPLFKSLTSVQTNIDFSNNIIESEEFNINQYLYAHNGGGVSIGDFNNDGLADIFFTANQLANRLYLNNGDFTFDDVTKSSGISGLVGKEYWTTGSTVIDINNDGWLDIYVNQVSNLKALKGRNQLFINNGDGTFTDKAKQYGLALETYSQQAVFFDYDLDGDLDMYQLNFSVHELDVYGKAEKRSIRDSLAGDRLYRNDNNKFTDVSEISGIYGGATGYGLSVSISDLDNNGYPDIYVSNDFHENDYVYYNQSDRTFLEDVEGTFGHTSTFSMGSDVADINNDGLLDIMTLDMKPEDEIIRKSSSGADSYEIYNYKQSFGYNYQYPRNMLQLNRGKLFENHNTQFGEVGQIAGIDATDWSWSVLLADFDNDGLKDIHITNGILRRPNDLDYINFTYNKGVMNNMSTLELAYMMPDGKSKNYAYRNLGKLAFENVSESWGLDYEGYSMGAAYVDLDNDGDLDLVINNLNETCSVFKNNADIITNNNYLKISLEGSEENINGIGARVEIQVGEKTMVQELYPVRGWISSSDFVLNFGLGESNSVNRVKVKWFDGKVQELENVKSNQLLKLSYSDADEKNINKLTKPKLFKNITETTNIKIKHNENSFVDFNIEQLIPHMLSVEGPKIAIADVNGDGMEDFFVGNAKGQSSELFIQKIENDVYGFEKVYVEAFEIDKNKEAVESVFFDADGDGDNDLYVVSGGGQSKNGENNRDRLYINTGEGQFKISDQLPIIDSNGSCVVAADFNGDSYMDLFVGSRSIYSSYGLSPDSYLLLNNGKGKFRIDTSHYSDALKGLGMVTDAVWNHESNELIVVGEWMPITFLKFNDQKINKRELENTSGWWNTIHSSDLDNDGDMDFLIGNLGLNSELKASVKEPVKLIIKDWDKNSTIDPLLVYHKQGKEWIFNGLDELKKQIPLIKKRYNNYSLFANHTLNQVFTEKDLSTAIIKTSEIFNSVILYNDNGVFHIENLPVEVQISPVNSFLTDDFNSDGLIDILAVGNYYGNAPVIGRHDASYGGYLTGIKKNKFNYIEPRISGFSFKGEARDIKSIKVGNEKWILVGINDDELKIFNFN